MAFKLDHLHPIKPLLFWKIFTIFTFILGGQFLLPQRANKAPNFPYTRSRCSRWLLAIALRCRMATIDPEAQFERPVQATLKAGDVRSRIGRCVVCMRKPPDRIAPMQ